MHVNIVGSNVQLPVDIKSRYATTIQTHNAVSVTASGWSTPSTWIDCNGFDQIAATMINDATTTNMAQVLWSHDGVTQHGEENIIASNALNKKAGSVPIKARYAKIALNNGDAAIAHIMSAWAYLKA